jgi:hypothetical protein
LEWSEEKKLSVRVLGITYYLLYTAKNYNFWTKVVLGTAFSKILRREYFRLKKCYDIFNSAFKPFQLDLVNTKTNLNENASLI